MAWTPNPDMHPGEDAGWWTDPARRAAEVADRRRRIGRAIGKAQKAQRTILDGLCRQYEAEHARRGVVGHRAAASADRGDAAADYDELGRGLMVQGRSSGRSVVIDGELHEVHHRVYPGSRILGVR